MLWLFAANKDVLYIRPYRSDNITLIGVGTGVGETGDMLYPSHTHSCKYIPVLLLDPDDPGETGKPGEVIRGSGVAPPEAE